METFKQNLVAIIEKLRGALVFLVTLPPLDEPVRTAWDMNQGRGHERSFEQTCVYSQAIRDVAAELQNSPNRIVLIDLHQGLTRLAIEKTPGYKLGDPPIGAPNGKSEALQEYLKDGLHMNDKGYEILWGLTKAFFEEATCHLVYRWVKWEKA